MWGACQGGNANTARRLELERLTARDGNVQDAVELCDTVNIVVKDSVETGTSQLGHYQRERFRMVDILALVIPAGLDYKKT